MTSGSMTVVACSGAGSARSIGMFDLRERRDVLRHAVLEDLEVVAAQVADEAALAIEDRGVDFDVVDLDLEGDLRLVVGRSRGRRLLSHQPAPAVAAKRKSQHNPTHRVHR